MTENYFKKNPKNKFNENFIFNDEQKQNLIDKNPLINDVIKVNFNGQINYNEQLETISVIGVLDFELLAIDAMNGAGFVYKDSIDWENTYTFSEDIAVSMDADIILSNDFDLAFYALEEIQLSLPISIFSKAQDKPITNFGNDWKLYSEEEYEKEKDNTNDQRWDKLQKLK
ncbi:hypothetical protein [Spiroplasma endosymbiont of Labia minor]|uniref:hypothetical protein n=1 Tax=Spiroplasma endosymbiont of Labia minor TaxID=3066305 RepID=UPI0030CE0712